MKKICSIIFLVLLLRIGAEASEMNWLVTRPHRLATPLMCGTRARLPILSGDFVPAEGFVFDAPPHLSFAAVALFYREICAAREWAREDWVYTPYAYIDELIFQTGGVK